MTNHQLAGLLRHAGAGGPVLCHQEHPPVKHLPQGGRRRDNEWEASTGIGALLRSSANLHCTRCGLLGAERGTRSSQSKLAVQCFAGSCLQYIVSTPNSWRGCMSTRCAECSREMLQKGMECRGASQTRAARIDQGGCVHVEHPEHAT